MIEAIKDAKQINAVKKLLADSPRNLLLFVMGINTGLRISDLLQLKVEDISKNGKIKSEFTITEQKTGKTRTITINTAARRALEDFLKGTDYDTSSYLFTSRKGQNKPITRVQAWTILDNVGKILNISLGTHSLRKTFGYHAYNQGIDITLLQDLFGHSSPAITLRYIGITAEDIQNVYNNLSL